ncbi:MAG: TRAP transporter substrate-binding protein DctP [Desulfosalsimonas sp.]
MKVIFRVLTLAVMTACAALLGINAEDAEAAEKVTWKLPMHHTTEESPVYKHSIMKIIDEVKEQSDGNFVIEPYLGGTLMPGTQLFTAVRRGMVPMVHTTPAYDLDEEPLFNILAGLPMNFAEVWEAAYFHKWLGFEQLVKDQLEKKHGLLYYSDRVYPTELTLQKPVRSMEDFEGLKLRSSGILQKYLTSIGASAEMIPGGDIYPALASGMVEGAHWGAVQGAYAMGFYEVNDYHLRTPLNIAATDIWLINKEAFEELPEEYQEILHTALKEHFWPRTNQYNYQEEMELQRAIEKYDTEVITLPDEEFKKMQKAAVEIWEDVAEKSPECAEAVEMIKEFNRDMGRLD